MKKTILILLSFISSVCLGQPPGTPSYYWNDSIRAADSALISTAGDSIGHLTNVDFDITLGYLPIRTGAFIQINDIETPVCCISDWKRNYNYDSLMFFQHEARTVNSDSSEVLPLRITEVAIYSTATDADSYFNVNEIPVGAVWVPGDYDTINAAIVAAGFGGDIILVKESTQRQLRNNKPNLSIHAVGEVDIVDTDYAFECRADNQTHSGFECNSSFSINAVYLNGATNVNCYNNYYYPTSNATISVGILTAPAYIKDSYIGSNARPYSTSDSTIIEGCYINNTGTTSPAHLTQYSCLYKFCNIENMGADWFNQTHTKINFGFYGNEINMGIGSFYTSIADTNTYYFEGNTIAQDDSVFFYIDNDNTWSFKNNTYTGYGNSLVLELLDDGNHITFQDNDFTFNTSISDFTIQCDFLKENIIDSISGNTVIWPSTATYKGRFIRIQSTDSVFFCNNTLVNNIDDFDSDCDFIHVDPNVYDPVYKCVISGNTLTQKNGGAHGIYIGNEANTSGNNKVNNIVIEYNKLTARYSTTGTINGSYHGIFVGFQSDPIVRYNYVEGSPLAYIHKGNGTTTKGGRFYGNVAKDFLQGQLMKGVDSTFIYNNTFFSGSNVDISNQRGVLVFENNLHSGEQSDNCQIINNIISIADSDGSALYVADSSYLGLISDYNILDANYGCNYLGDKISFAAWKDSSSQDANSFNSDPNLNSAGIAASNSDAIGNATDLGSPYTTLLADSTVWPDAVYFTVNDSIVGAYGDSREVVSVGAIDLDKSANILDNSESRAVTNLDINSLDD